MRDLFILLGHLLTTITKLLRPGGPAGHCRRKHPVEAATPGAQTVLPAPFSAELTSTEFGGRPIVGGYSNRPWLRNWRFAMHRRPEGNLAGNRGTR